MDKLSNIIAFVTVAETKSFAETARRLRVANSVISKRIKDLEEHLQTALLQRTTRHLALTDAGFAYFEHARKWLDELAEVEEHLRYRNENPVGEIRVGAPLSFGNLFMGPAVASFLEQHPDVTVRLIVNDAATEGDFPQGEFDLLIRLGEMKDSSLLTKRLAESRRVVVGAPAYFAQNGKPQTPEDLARHNCMSFTGLAEGKAWPFRKGSRDVWQRVDGRFSSDSGTLLCEAAVRGCGLAFLPTFIAGPHIVSGALDIALEDHEQAPLSIQAVYPQKRLLSARVRHFLDHLARHFSAF